MLENKTVNLKDWNQLTSLYDQGISNDRGIEIWMRTEFFVIYNEDPATDFKEMLENKTVNLEDWN